MGVVRGLLLLLVPLVLSGCAGLFRGDDGLFGKVTSLSPPIVSDRFLLSGREQRVVGELQIIETRYDDTFVDIARTYNLGFDELVEANPQVDPWLPGEGTRIVLPTRFVLPDAERKGIVINIASKRLFFFPEPDEDGAQAVITHPIGIGREGAATPIGVTTVTSKGRDPVWWPTASIRREYAAKGDPLPAQVMPGPDNPLGRYVLILGMPSYLIHGTNKPAGVGMRVSHGCVRLFPENIEALFELAPVGVKVTIVNQPYSLSWEGGQLLLEAHAPLVDDERDWAELLSSKVSAALAANQIDAAVDWQRVNDVREAAFGVPLPILESSPGVADVLRDATLVNNLVAHIPSDKAH